MFAVILFLSYPLSPSLLLSLCVFIYNVYISVVVVHAVINSLPFPNFCAYSVYTLSSLMLSKSVDKNQAV